MTPPASPSLAAPSLASALNRHDDHHDSCHDSCREARLYIPLLAVSALVGLVIMASDDLLPLTYLLWALTMLGWLPVAFGLVHKTLARLLLFLRPLPVAKSPTQKDTLPFITILLPVMDEAAMMPQLATAMARLDYPPDRLDCMVLLEAVDRSTPIGAMQAAWPDFCRLVSVPQGSPQTKARACNYALRRARGDLLVIFDAEDQPHPQQMREAARRFARHGDRLACLQAPLYIQPQGSHWLENQFALEYSLLFNFILPCLGRANGALPLGGSSNYFRLSALRAVSGWDDYNLTEDADLGMRLAQNGYRIDTLKLPTYENAPHKLPIFHRQRTRWLSGHIQTLHTQMHNWRRPSGGFWLSLSCGSILIGRLATIPAHALSIGLLAQHGLGLATAGMAIPAFAASYVGLVVLLYRIGRAPTRRARLFFAMTHWLYWLAMLPAFFNALKRMAFGQVEWLKSPHIPFTRHAPNNRSKNH